MPPDTDELFYCLVRTKGANQSWAKCLATSSDSPSPHAGDAGRAEGSSLLPFSWEVEVWWRGGAGLYIGQPEGRKYICKKKKKNHQIVFFSRLNFFLTQAKQHVT